MSIDRIVERGIKDEVKAPCLVNRMNGDACKGCGESDQGEDDMNTEAVKNNSACPVIKVD